MGKRGISFPYRQVLRMLNINVKFVIATVLYFVAGFLSFAFMFDNDLTHLLYISLAFLVFLLLALSTQEEFFGRLFSHLNKKPQYLQALRFVAWESTLCMGAWLPVCSMTSLYDRQFGGIESLWMLLLMNAYAGYLLLIISFVPTFIYLSRRTSLPRDIHSNIISYIVYLVLIGPSILLLLGGGGVGMIGW